MELIALLSDIKEYVEQLFKQSNPIHLCYHNLQHTKKVVGHCSEIGAFYQLDEESTFILHTAAWFHDTGHLLGYLQGHEDASIAIMQVYFKANQFGVANSIIDDIEKCILSTKNTVLPTCALEKILCDADTYHFGTYEFKEVDPLVEREIELRTGKFYQDWDRKTLHMLETHQFFTAYCLDRLSRGKQANIDYIKQRIAVKCS